MMIKKTFHKRQAYWLTRNTGVTWMLVALAFPVSAQFRQVHCTDCGKLLTGSARVEYETLQWMGPGNPLSISVSFAGREEAGSFGPSGSMQYRLDARYPGIWNYETLTTYTIANLVNNNPSPSLSPFFSPATAGVKTGRVYCSALHESGPATNCKITEMQGEGVADSTSAPALTLDVTADGGSEANGFYRFNDILVVGPERGVSFTVTPKYDPAKVDATVLAGLYSPKHVVVSLFVKEENTNCQSQGQSFRGRPVTMNNFQPSQYFQYLYEVDSRGTPTSCNYEVAFLATLGQPFSFMAINHRSTGTGQAKFTFAVRGHMDFANPNAYPGSHYTYALRTVKPDCAAETCVLNTTTVPTEPVTPTTPATPVVTPTQPITPTLPDQATVTCESQSCAYAIPLQQPGFYVAETSVMANGKEGFWGGEYTTAQGRNTGGFNMGAALKEKGEQPGFMAFYLDSAEAVRIKPYEYSGQVGIFNVTVLRQDATGARTAVYGPVQSISGQSHETPQLAGGFYVVEVQSLDASVRGQFGVEVNAVNMSGGVNVGGWLDGNGKGFAGLYITTPQLANFKLYFGQSYGTVGADKPDLAVYLMEGANKNLVYSSTQ